MAEPLDYFNPAKPPEPATRGERPAPVRAAIPPEFDVALTKSADHPAVRAIATALQKQKIPHHICSGDDASAGRVVEIYVRAAEQARAMQIATRIFVTRKKLKSYPRPQMPQERSSWPDPFGFTSFMP